MVIIYLGEEILWPPNIYRRINAGAKIHNRIRGKIFIFWALFWCLFHFNIQ